MHTTANALRAQMSRAAEVVPHPVSLGLSCRVNMLSRRVARWRAARARCHVAHVRPVRPASWRTRAGIGFAPQAHLLCQWPVCEDVKLCNPMPNSNTSRALLATPHGVTLSSVPLSSDCRCSQCAPQRVATLPRSRLPQGAFSQGRKLPRLTGQSASRDRPACDAFKLIAPTPRMQASP